MKKFNVEIRVEGYGEEDKYTVPLGRAYVPVLKALDVVDFPYYMAKMSKLTGLQEHICKQRIQNLMKSGWKFTVHINEVKLGLKKLIIVLRNKPRNILIDYLRSVIRTVSENYYILSYYLPVSHEPADIVNYYKDNVVDYYVLMGFERTSPGGILRYYDQRMELIRVGYDKLLETLTSEYDKPLTITFSDKSSFGGIDLILLKELQKNPFLTYKELSKRTGLSYSRILRRMKLLVREGVLGSIRVMKLPGPHQFIGMITVHGIKPYRELIERLVSLPFISGVGYSADTLMLSVRLMWRSVGVLSDVVEVLSGRYEVRPYLIDPRIVKTYTIPYRQEYSKYEGWVFKVSSVRG